MLSFEERQYLRHAVSEARKAILAPNRGTGCPGCGCHKDNRTEGCPNCRDRHYARSRRARWASGHTHFNGPRIRALRDGLCLNCGVPYSEQTPGCAPCYDRARRRRDRSRYASAA